MSQRPKTSVRKASSLAPKAASFRSAKRATAHGGKIAAGGLAVVTGKRREFEIFFEDRRVNELPAF